MSDAYQAIYDAANLNLGNLSGLHHHITQEIYSISNHMTAPHVLMRPSISIDGNQWCALYGDNIQDGVAGFGDTPEKAMAAFDVAWFKEDVSNRVVSK